jgi:hypothetical protein
MSNNLNLIKMKKVLLIIGFLVSVNLIFAQSQVSLSLPNIEVTDVPQNVDVNVHIDFMTANLVVGVQLSILYDQTKLTWLGTPAAPAPGVPYQHVGFTAFGSDYLWNTNFPGNLIMLWSDPTYVGFPAFAGEDIITFRFAYNGTLAPGEHSPISYSLTYLLKDGGYTKIVNELTDENFSPYEFVGACGGLCPGEIFRAGGVTGKVWTGLGGDLNWNNPGNWAPPGEPTSTDDVTINASKAPMVVISGGAATCGALTVALGAGVNVAPTGSLTTNGLYTNNGQLIISSNSSGFSGSYINNGAIAGTGTYEFDRDQKCVDGALPFGSWHYLAAPVDGVGTPNMWDYYVNSWSEPTSAWVHQYGVPPNVPCNPITLALNGLSAWAINHDAAYVCGATNPATGQIIEMVGPAIHTGPYAAPYTFTPGLYQGWNMFGNPYPSSIDPATIAFPGNMAAGVAMYDGCLNTYHYSTFANGWNPAVPLHPEFTGKIPPTQGFFVQATGAGAFSVTDANRVHDLGGSYYKEEVTDLLILQASNNEQSDVLYVRFMDGATPVIDNYDFQKMFSTANGLPQIYTKVGEDMLAVNALPETKAVPMGFTSETSGTYTIEAVETSEFANVVLEDLANGIETDLLNGSYTFEYTTGAEHGFVIHFTPLGTPELAANNINIWAADHNIYVQAPATTGDIVVYNLMGQEVVKTNIEAGLNVIPMTDVNTYYIVKVIGSDVTETGKVFIK